MNQILKYITIYITFNLLCNLDIVYCTEVIDLTQDLNDDEKIIFFRQLIVLNHGVQNNVGDVIDTFIPEFREHHYNKVKELITENQIIQYVEQRFYIPITLDQPL